MKSSSKRKEVVLDEEIIEILEFQAKSVGRNLKNYMEFILSEKAHNFQITEDYKTLMDTILDSHTKGKNHYISKEDFFREVQK